MAQVIISQVSASGWLRKPRCTTCWRSDRPLLMASSRRRTGTVPENEKMVLSNFLIVKLFVLDIISLLCCLYWTFSLQLTWKHYLVSNIVAMWIQWSLNTRVPRLMSILSFRSGNLPWSTTRTRTPMTLRSSSTSLRFILPFLHFSCPGFVIPEILDQLIFFDFRDVSYSGWFFEISITFWIVSITLVSSSNRQGDVVEKNQCVCRLMRSSPTRRSARSTTREAWRRSRWVIVISLFTVRYNRSAGKFSA